MSNKSLKGELAFHIPRFDTPEQLRIFIKPRGTMEGIYLHFSDSDPLGRCCPVPCLSKIQQAVKRRQSQAFWR